MRTRKSSKSLFEYQPSYLFILVSFFFFAVFLYLIFMIIVICEAKASRLSSSSGAVNGWLAGWLIVPMATEYIHIGEDSFSTGTTGSPSTVVHWQRGGQ